MIQVPEDKVEHYYVCYSTPTSSANCIIFPQEKGPDGFNICNAMAFLGKHHNCLVILTFWMPTTKARFEQFNSWVLGIAENKATPEQKKRPNHLSLIKSSPTLPEKGPHGA